MKNTDDFCNEGKPSRATAKSTLFAVSKDEWDTKEDTGKSMKKGTSRVEATLNSERIRPVALAVIKLRLSEGINQLLSQLLSQSVENSVYRRFPKISASLNIWHSPCFEYNVL